MILAKLSDADIAGLVAVGLGTLTALFNVMAARMVNGQHKQLVNTINKQVDSSNLAIVAAKEGLSDTNKSLSKIIDKMSG